MNDLCILFYILFVLLWKKFSPKNLINQTPTDQITTKEITSIVLRNRITSNDKPHPYEYCPTDKLFIKFQLL
jgi:hypothetical protein